MKGTQANKAPREARLSAGSDQPETSATDRMQDERFKSMYRDASYYSAGRNWQDYAPAYRYGLQSFSGQGEPRQRFEDVERALEQNWDDARDGSRLGWVEAREAVRDAWRQAEQDAPSDHHPTSGDCKPTH